MNQLNELHVKRLAYVRYLYSAAVEQSYRPAPVSSFSLLGFHDAIEMFLILGAERHNADVGRRDSIDVMWDKIAAKVAPDEMFGKVAMLRLNGARIELKHRGTLPGGQTIEESRAAASTIINDNCEVLFGIPFASVSLAHLVEYKAARKQLEKAINAAAERQYQVALDCAAIAHRILVLDYVWKSNLSGKRPSLMGIEYYPRLGSPNDKHYDAARCAVEHIVNKITPVIEKIYEDMTELRIGLYGHEYIRFSQLAPDVSLTAGSNSVVVVRKAWTRAVDERDVNYCIDYVVSTALRLQSGATDENVTDFRQNAVAYDVDGLWDDSAAPWIKMSRMASRLREMAGEGPAVSPSDQGDAQE